MARVRVIGAGVIGLSCAVRLLEAGHEVTVLTEQDPQQTTSRVAGALWYPYLAAPVERVTAWGVQTLRELIRLAEAEPASGVHLVDGTEVGVGVLPDPAWAAEVLDFRRVAGRDGEPGGGWAFAAPLADMSVYLGWLVRRVEALGGRIERRRLQAVPDDGVPTVVAAGLGARELLPDPSMSTARGQILLLRQCGLTRWALDQTGEQPVYVFPRERDIVVGGTSDPADTRIDPDPSIGAAVLDRAVKLVPELAGAQVREHRVGLRPVRPAVRLAAETLGATPVVHCYGHGGAGVTLSWGCADEAAALLEASL